ncbi:hypothetical protein [Streptomyces sp. DH10]|uniref:hypothetical protein n=1 Tax=Streptomyces sp. DH10 TaxID=3040121 RepID=UPI0024426FBF|nr:hypothetical protein [Streptomyces sp. DH10]MDG9709579.1 hypothetical protein [Streptomyces sp. DH10]
MTAVTTDALVPALEDARDAHSAIIDRFRADIAVHATGPRREVLERHIDSTYDCVARIDGHMRELRPGRPLRDTADRVRLTARATVRMAGLLLEIGAAITTAILHRRKGPSPLQVVRHTENEYSITARALAACRAGESIAEQAHDQVAADLLATLRRQDEELLATLEDRLAQQARATAVAGSGHGTQSGDGGPPDATTSTVHSAVKRVRKAAEGGAREATHTATDALRRMPEEDDEAVTREEEPPILGYEHFRVADIVQRLPRLSQAQLSALDGYERAHASRPEILNAIERLRGSEPWPGYDAMIPDQITARLQTAAPAEARQVLDYERRHRQRGTLIAIAKARSVA